MPTRLNPSLWDGGHCTKIHSLGTDNPLLQCPPYSILLVMANFLMLLLPKTHIPHPAIPESTIARASIQ
ncbi:MAG: hypothetical protein AB4426_13010 [Xenococcaceae cyanobacterium]